MNPCSNLTSITDVFIVRTLPESTEGARSVAFSHLGRLPDRLLGMAHRDRIRAPHSRI